jgi:hypothetical protein
MGPNVAFAVLQRSNPVCQENALPWRATLAGNYLGRRRAWPVPLCYTSNPLVWERSVGSAACAEATRGGNMLAQLLPHFTVLAILL